MKTNRKFNIFFFDMSQSRQPDLGGLAPRRGTKAVHVSTDSKEGLVRAMHEPILKDTKRYSSIQNKVGRRSTITTKL